LLPLGGVAAVASEVDRSTVSAIRSDDGATRPHDANDEMVAAEDDEDNDKDRAGYNTVVNDQMAGGDNTGDGDARDRDDGTAGGNNT
jgi:hypothetical protein